MAASPTLPRYSDSHKFGKTGVLTISGYGVKVLVRSGHLHIEDGAGPERRVIRLPRVGHGLKRLVCISEDGFITLSGLKWLSEVGAAFLMLTRMGKVQFMTAPSAPSDSRLRRSQALSTQTGAALKIAKTLIAQKMAGQESLVRDKLKNPATADMIAQFRSHLEHVDELVSVRNLESQAARAYWGAWHLLPVNFPTKDENRLPEHWKTFGQRISQLTGSPRLATNPPNAILNYCYCLLEAETRLAASALGLDCSVGLLHADTPNRDSLVLDILEAVRPCVDLWLLDWLLREQLSRSWFFETTTGNCRLMSSFATELSRTAPTWGGLVAPWAEYVAHALWAKTKSIHRAPATRLTQTYRREAKGSPPLPAKPAPQPPRICGLCGTQIQRGRYCALCTSKVSRKNLINVAHSGRIAAQAPEAQARRAATKRRQDFARSGWLASGHPAWLNNKTYLEKIQPRLAAVTYPSIASALNVSQPYAADIRAGRRTPHPRHWKVLAELVGVSPEERKTREFPPAQGN